MNKKERIRIRMKAYNQRPEVREQRNLNAYINYHRHSKRAACKILYRASRQLKDDKDSLLRNTNFVKDFVGVVCPRLEAIP